MDASAPETADAHCDQAVAWHRAGEAERAAEACRAALALDPHHAAARLNLACILRELDRLEEAVEQAGQAMERGYHAGDADLVAEARFNRGLALLGLGRRADGWADWDARLSLPAWGQLKSGARWQGGSLDGGRLVVRREQGLGDELVFATGYRELLRRASGGDVLIECDARLQAPLARALPGTTFHPIDTAAGLAAAQSGQPPPATAARAPAGALWIAAGSLPGLFGHPLATPEPAPLLPPLPALGARWRERIAALPGKGPVVGLCWRSSLTTGRRNRFQAPIEELAPLLADKRLRLVSLQIGVRPDERAHILELAALGSPGRKLIEFPEVDLVNDIEQAMALVAALDHVVTVGTWILPLAGCVGTPAWYMASLRDYWTLGTEAVPWFARMRRVPVAGRAYRPAAQAIAGRIAAGEMP